MTITCLPTEPLRAEHRDLLEKLQAFQGVAGELPDVSAAEATRHLTDVIEFFQHRVASHAAAEEAVLFPCVDRVTNDRTVTVPFRANHLEIGARTQVLVETTAEIGEEWPDRSLSRSLSRQFVKLAAVVMLHLGNEEELLFPVLDEHLSTEDVRRLLERMGEVAHTVSALPTAGQFR
jgi:iron-sulfur cluster repair protein YtfE (RIC family)